MSRKFSRRTFIKKGAALSASSIIGGNLLYDLARSSGSIGNQEKSAGNKAVNIAAITGKDYFGNTIETVALLGGMKKYVSAGDRVFIIPNTVRNYPGTNVQPEVMLALVKMCYQAGAKEITLAKAVAEGYWDNCKIAADYAEEIKSLKVSPGEHEIVAIPKGIKCKEAHVLKELLSYDRFINLGIVKHHTGTRFTGILKNMMGACPHDPTNRFFHYGSNPNADGFYEDVDFLSQCIADLNLLRKPDLCINDAVEFLTTNGPFGPGETKRADTITAGTDPVAVDAYSLRFLGLKLSNVAMIGMAEKHGIGISDLSKINIKELTV